MFNIILLILILLLKNKCKENSYMYNIILLILIQLKSISERTVVTCLI